MEKTEPRLIRIPDPVHGSIPVEARFLDIIDTPEFQRLRSIEQGSFRPVFPGARHDRFIHSLGAYHLAGKFADCFFRNLREDVEDITLSEGEENELKLTLRYAALLHDVGHAPFSHTTENLFLEQKDPATGLPLIWTQLCDEIDRVAAPDAGRRFRSAAGPVGSAHEIMSAILLIRNRKTFMPARSWGRAKVDLELAARMVIGYPYDLRGIDDAELLQRSGIRNCLIQLLNSSVMDVDRLDYLGRDTRASGFVNAPLDLDALARSVTAVWDGKHLVIAYRSRAISAIETMFHAKLSHDAWVLGHPAGVYDAALQAHCIRLMDQKYQGRYIPNVFSVDALGVKGVRMGSKRYRLLCDADITADMKAQTDADFDELFTRLPGQRRTAVWSSYYEFCHLFTDPVSGLTPTDVCRFFSGLMGYLRGNHIFAFTAQVHARIVTEIPDESDPVRKSSDLLHSFLLEQQLKGAHPRKPYSAVLLPRSLNFTMQLDPDQIRIVFTKKNFPSIGGKPGWTTLGKLQGITGTDRRQEPYFYLFRHGGLGSRQLADLCAALRTAIK